MKFLRSVEASHSHMAHWYSCSKQELEAKFSAHEVRTLIEGISNGVTSQDNQSKQTANGLSTIAMVSLESDYVEWAKANKPHSSLHFHFIEMKHKAA